MNGPLNGPGVRDAILKQGKTATESTAYFWGNLTKGVQDSSKGVLTVYSGRRVGYISQLWKDTNDIEFVKQSLGYRKMDSTSSYVKELSDQER